MTGRTPDPAAQDSLLAGKRIGLLTTAISHLGGGVAEAVATQARIIGATGATPVILALNDPHVADAMSRLANTEIRLVERRGPRIVGFAPGLIAALHDARLDCLHLHGIWQYPSRAASQWAQRSGRPYIISPHGMLDRWITARGRWKKALVRSGYERASWQSASLFHALTGLEADDIQRETGRHDIAVIPNPVAQVDGFPQAGRGPEILYIGRIHPKKNLTNLLAAWTRLASSGRLPADAQLTIAGWGDPADVAQFHRDLVRAPASVQFVGACFGADKAARLAHARFVVLPSYSEGLPMSVLEAWAAGTPVLMSAHCNLPEGFTARAALDCGVDVAAIEASVTTALALPEPEWQAMSDAAVALARGPFSAATVTAAWQDRYSQLLGRERTQP